MLVVSFLLLAGCTSKAADDGGSSFKALDSSVLESADDYAENTVLDNPITASNAVNVNKATLRIDGMTCTSCALGVEYQLKNVEGVISAEVDYDKGLSYVTYDSDITDAQSIAQASDVYPAEVIADEKIS